MTRKHLRRFGYHVSKLIPERQQKGEFRAKSKLGCMMGYVHDSTTTWRVWDPEYPTVRTQSDVIFDEARNVYASLPGDPEATTDTLGLVKEVVHVEVLEGEVSGNAAKRVGGNASRRVGGNAARRVGGNAASGKQPREPVAPLQTPLYSLNTVELVVLQTMAALGDGDSRLLSQLGRDCPEKKLAWKGQDREEPQEAWSRGSMQKARWSWKHWPQSQSSEILRHMKKP